MAKRKVNIELLKRLRSRFLRMKHSEHFDMDTVAERNECGTAMCIAGHALQLQGYRFRFDKYGVLSDVVRPGGTVVSRGLLVIAAREIGLPYGEWRTDQPDLYDLFNDLTIRTPKEAAERIQELIEQMQ